MSCSDITHAQQHQALPSRSQPGSDTSPDTHFRGVASLQELQIRSRLWYQRRSNLLCRLCQFFATGKHQHFSHQWSRIFREFKMHGLRSQIVVQFFLAFKLKDEAMCHAFTERFPWSILTYVRMSMVNICLSLKRIMTPSTTYQLLGFWSVASQSFYWSTSASDPWIVQNVFRKPPMICLACT